MTTTLDGLKTALVARRGYSYIAEFEAYYDALTAKMNAIGADLISTSTTSASIGTGAKSLVIETEQNFAAGQYVIAFETATPSNFMIGLVTAYNAETGALAFTVADGDTNGAGTIAAWTVALTGRRGATGATGGISGGAMTGDLDMNGNVLAADLVRFDTGSEHLPSATSAPAAVSGAQTLYIRSYAANWIVANGDVTLTISAGTTAGYRSDTKFIFQQDAVAGRNLTIVGATWYGAAVDFTAMTANQKVLLCAWQSTDGTIFVGRASEFY